MLLKTNVPKENETMRPKNELQERIAKNIKEWRDKCGWTQAELAERLNIGRGAVAKYESCARTPDIYQLNQIAQVFGTTVDALMR